MVNEGRRNDDDGGHGGRNICWSASAMREVHVALPVCAWCSLDCFAGARPIRE